MDNRKRDRGATEERVLDAAAELLARDGAGALGVNALAKEAGCDKQLIYRYFGGLDGVMEALGERVAERLAQALDLHRPAGGSAVEVNAALARGLIAAYRADPLLARLKAAEWSSPGGAFAGFAKARGKVLSAWAAAWRSRSETAPEDRDTAALTALVVGAIEAAALSAAATGSMAGVPLKTDAEWDRIEAAVVQLVVAAFGEQPGGERT
jgi:AcrR family transcriptional regulator